MFRFLFNCKNSACLIMRFLYKNCKNSNYFPVVGLQFILVSLQEFYINCVHNYFYCPLRWDDSSEWPLHIRWFQGPAVSWFCWHKGTIRYKLSRSQFCGELTSSSTINRFKETVLLSEWISVQSRPNEGLELEKGAQFSSTISMASAWKGD